MFHIPSCLINAFLFLVCSNQGLHEVYTLHEADVLSSFLAYNCCSSLLYTLATYLLKKPSHLSYNGSHILHFADCIDTILCPLGFL